MLSVITPRIYVVVALITAAIAYFLQLTPIGASLITAVNGVSSTAIQWGMSPALVSIVRDPFAFVLSEPLGALALGLLWPLGLLWLLLLVLVWIHSFIAPLALEARNIV